MVVLPREAGRNVGPTKMLGVLEVRGVVDVGIGIHADIVWGGADTRRCREGQAEESRVVGPCLCVQRGEKHALGACPLRGGAREEGFRPSGGGHQLADGRVAGASVDES